MKHKKTEIKIFIVEIDDIISLITLCYKDDLIMTDQYRPSGLNDFMEDDIKDKKKFEEEFQCIITKYILGLRVCEDEKDILKRNIGALTYTIMDYIFSKGSITFRAVLKHIDCFSMMLREAGWQRNQIKSLYEPILRAVTSNFKSMIV